MHTPIAMLDPKWDQLHPPALPYCAKLTVIGPWDDELHTLNTFSIPFTVVLTWCTAFSQLVVLDINGIANVTSADTQYLPGQPRHIRLPGGLRSLTVQGTPISGGFWGLCAGWVETLTLTMVSLKDPFVVSGLTAICSSLSSLTISAFPGEEPLQWPLPGYSDSFSSMLPSLEKLDFRVFAEAFADPFRHLKSRTVHIYPNFGMPTLSDGMDIGVNVVCTAIEKNKLPQLQELNMYEPLEAYI